MCQFLLLKFKTHLSHLHTLIQEHTITNSMYTIVLNIKYSYRKVRSANDSGFWCIYKFILYPSIFDQYTSNFKDIGRRYLKQLYFIISLSVLTSNKLLRCIFDAEIITRYLQISNKTWIQTMCLISYNYPFLPH